MNWQDPSCQQSRIFYWPVVMDIKEKSVWWQRPARIRKLINAKHIKDLPVIVDLNEKSVWWQESAPGLAKENAPGPLTHEDTNDPAEVLGQRITKEKCFWQNNVAHSFAERCKTFRPFSMFWGPAGWRADVKKCVNWKAGNNSCLSGGGPPWTWRVLGKTLELDFRS